MQKERMSNFELLRIISMLFIVSHHYIMHGVGFDNCIGINKIFALFFTPLGKIGVNIFVLISGFFLCQSAFKIRKVFSLISDTLIFSITFFLCCIFFKLNTISLDDIVKSFFPIIFSSYWFITAYIGLYLIFPLLNTIIKNISKDLYKWYLLLFFFIFSLIPTFTNAVLFTNDLLWFIYLYCVAAYIRKYNIIENKSYLFWIYVLFFTMLLLFSIILFSSYMSQYYSIFRKFVLYFNTQNSIFVFIISIALFIIFANLKINKSKILNSISMSTFGVYLFHENFLFRNFLWQDIFHSKNIINSPFLIFMCYLIFVTTAVFIIGIILDKIEKKCKSFFSIKIKFILKLENNINERMLSNNKLSE